VNSVFDPVEQRIDHTVLRCRSNESAVLVTGAHIFSRSFASSATSTSAKFELSGQRQPLRCRTSDIPLETDHEKASDRNRHFFACLTLTTAAEARTSYDGPWNLVFHTQSGSCDPTYTFSVDVTDGNVTHPNLVKFRGHVAKSGAVRASVTVHDKYASGSGRLTGDSGRGTWSGRAGAERCSGYWTAQRNQ
jgi:hypothetical protein